MNLSNGNAQQRKLNSGLNFLIVLLTIKDSDSKNSLYFSCYILINKGTVVSFFPFLLSQMLFPSFKNPHSHNIFCAAELVV